MKNSSRFLSFLLSVALVFTTFGSDMASARVFAEEDAAIVVETETEQSGTGTVDGTGETGEDVLPAIFERLDDVETVDNAGNTGSTQETVEESNAASTAETTEVVENAAVGDTAVAGDTAVVGDTAVAGETTATGETAATGATPVVGETTAASTGSLVGETPVVGATPAAVEASAVAVIRTANAPVNRAILLAEAAPADTQTDNLDLDNLDEAALLALIEEDKIDEETARKLVNDGRLSEDALKHFVKAEATTAQNAENGITVSYVPVFFFKDGETTEFDAVHTETVADAESIEFKSIQYEDIKTYEEASFKFAGFFRDASCQQGLTDGDALTPEGKSLSVYLKYDETQIDPVYASYTIEYLRSDGAAEGTENPYYVQDYIILNGEVGTSAQFELDEKKYDNEGYAYKKTLYFSRGVDDTELTGADKDKILKDSNLIIKVYYDLITTADFTVEYYVDDVIDENSTQKVSGTIGTPASFVPAQDKYLEDGIEYLETKYFSRVDGVDTELTEDGKDTVLRNNALVIKVFYKTEAIADFRVEYFKDELRVDYEVVKDAAVGQPAVFALDKDKFSNAKYVYSDIKYYSRKTIKDIEGKIDYVDTELTGEGNDKVLAGDKLVIKVFYTSNFDHDDTVYFFIIKEKDFDPNEWEQNSDHYMPEGGNLYGGLIWPGTANNIEDIIANKNDYRSYGEWIIGDRDQAGDLYFSITDEVHGIDGVSGFQFNEGTKEKIDARVADYCSNVPEAFQGYTKYGFSEDDVIWYVYKRQNGTIRALHIDGYISTYITYHSDVPGGEYYDVEEPYTGARVRIARDAVVIDNQFNRPGYTFTGWVDELGNTYNKGDTIPNLPIKLHLYATWVKDTEVFSGDYVVEKYYQNEDGSFSSTANKTSDPVVVNFNSTEQIENIAVDAADIDPNAVYTEGSVNYKYKTYEKNVLTDTLKANEHKTLKIYYFRESLKNGSYEVRYYYQKVDGSFPAKSRPNRLVGPTAVTFAPEELGVAKTVEVKPEENVVRDRVNYFFKAEYEQNKLTDTVKPSEHKILYVYYFRDDITGSYQIHYFYQNKNGTFNDGTNGNEYKPEVESGVIPVTFTEPDYEDVPVSVTPQQNVRRLFVNYHFIDGYSGNLLSGVVKAGKNDLILKVYYFRDNQGKNLKVVADSDKREYNGTKLEKGTYQVFVNDVLVTDGSITATVEGSQTDVGTNDNIVTTITFGGNTYQVSRDANGKNPKIDQDEYDSVTILDGTLEVTPRPITLRSGDNIDQEFTGQPVTNEEVKVVEGSFVEGENVYVKMDPEAYAIYPGDDKPNLFDVTGPVPGTRLSNYVITKEYGRLSVLPLNGGEKKKLLISVDAGTGGGDRKVEYYNGQIQTLPVNISVDGNVYTATVTESEEATITPNMAEAIRRAVQTFVEGLRDFFVITAHAAEEANRREISTTITLNGVSFDVNGIYVYGGQGLDSDTYPVWLDTQNMAITVNEIPVTDQFEVEFTSATVTNERGQRRIGELVILPRPVTLTSGSDTKVYDGTPLTKPGVDVTGMGFVEGEVANIRATGSVTDPGYIVPNTIAYDKLANYKDSNYIVTIVEGNLEVTPVTPPDTPVTPPDTPVTPPDTPVTPPDTPDTPDEPDEPSEPPTTPPTTPSNPPLPQVLGATRDRGTAGGSGAAVLGARRGRTEDSTDMFGRIVTIIVAAGIGFTMVFIKRKKNEED